MMALLVFVSSHRCGKRTPCMAADGGAQGDQGPDVKGRVHGLLPL